MCTTICDFSLSAIKSRDARLEDKLVTTNFGTGTRGLADENELDCAVCIKPGTELAFEFPVQVYATLSPTPTDVLFQWDGKTPKHTTAIFRQVHKEHERMHHDALEFPDGSSVLLTSLMVGQKCKILQLPAPPKTVKEAEEQERVAYAG